MKVVAIILLVLGFLLLLKGILFKLQSWVDAYYGLYSGSCLMIIGVVILVFAGNKKNKSKL